MLEKQRYYSEGWPEEKIERIIKVFGDSNTVKRTGLAEWNPDAYSFERWLELVVNTLRVEAKTVSVKSNEYHLSDKERISDPKHGVDHPFCPAGAESILDGVMALPEFAEKTGRNLNTLRRMLLELKEAGVIRKSGKSTLVDYDRAEEYLSTRKDRRRK